ncbi:MAG TPA: 3-deoxy-8-phosphooctulonate synthase, partial [Kiloniellales bacterium]
MPESRPVRIGELTLGNDRPFALIAGPCQIESRRHALDMAQALKEASAAAGLGLIYKSSYDKANRTSLAGARGVGLEEGIEILAEVREAVGCPVLTDVHEPQHCAKVAERVDVLQIPAFLCRQTDLVVEAARTGRAVNIKKGQFMAPIDMRRIVDKAHDAGNERVTVTERGASFGYQNLVVDMRSFAWMQSDGLTVLYDVTHSLQLPGAAADGSGGLREFAEPLARAAVAAGADGVFVEIHPDPENAL